MSSGLSVSLSVSPNGDGDEAPQEHEWPGERWYNKIGPVAKVYSGGMKHSVMLYCKYENSVYIKESILGLLLHLFRWGACFRKPLHYRVWCWMSFASPCAECHRNFSANGKAKTDRSAP